MNLINQMLSELEKNNKSDFAAIPTLSSVSSAPKKQIRFLRWLILIGIVVVIVTLGIVWRRPPKIVFDLSKSFVIPKKETSVIKSLKNKVAPLPKEINLQNIILKHNNNQTILDFVLSAPTPYYLEYISEQQLMIILNNTKIAGNIPVSLDQSFIVALNTKQNKANLISTLTLLSGTKIDELQLIDTPTPHLHLVLSNPQATSNSTLSKVSVPLTPEEEATKQYQEIQQLLAQDRRQSAIHNLYLLIGNYPNNLEARILLVSLLIKEGKLQKADEVLTSYLEQHETSASLIKLKAHILVRQNNPRAAISLLQKYLMNVDDPEYLALLAALYQQQGQFMPAATIYDQLTKIEPQRTIWWIGLGTALENAGKKNAAKVAYQQAYKVSDVPPDLTDFLNKKIKR